MVVNDNFEKFYAEIVDTNGCCRVTIPKQIVDGVGWKAGDKVKILIRKIIEDDVQINPKNMSEK